MGLADSLIMNLVQQQNEQQKMAQQQDMKKQNSSDDLHLMARQISNLMDQHDKIKDQVGDSWGTVPKAAYADVTSALGMNPEMKTYKGLQKALIGPESHEIGQMKRLTDQDIGLIKGLTPTEWDSNPDATTQFTQMRKLLETINHGDMSDVFGNRYKPGS